MISGFLQAITSFGKELSGVDTAMENIKYKGCKLLIDHGEYVNACLLLKEDETESLKQKVRRATQEFERKFGRKIIEWIGDLDAFSGAFDIFDEVFEIHLSNRHKYHHLNQELDY